MYHHGDDAIFRKTLPVWVRVVFAISVLSILPVAASIVTPSIITSSLAKLFLAFGVMGFGLSTAGLIIHGVSMGYLPWRFMVSRSHNSVQFWLTILVMLCFALGLIFLGLKGVVVYVSNSTAS